MSSAEAELTAMFEACKELLSIRCLLDTLKTGIPLDALGCPITTHHSLKMELFTDSQSAQSITAMYGLLRRVKNVELRFRSFNTWCSRSVLGSTLFAVLTTRQTR